LKKTEPHDKKLFITCSKEPEKAKIIFPDQFVGPDRWHYLLPIDLPVYHE